MKLLIILSALFIVDGVIGLSFQGQDDLKSNMIVADENPKFTLADRREEMRKSRLYILGALMEQLVAWFFQDVIPKDVLHRTRRSLNIPEEKDASYLIDAAVTTLGAIMDREDCRKIVVCNACNAIKHNIPASQVAIVLADHYLPPNVKQWDKYTVARRVFFNEQNERCEELYHCKLETSPESNNL